MFTDIFNQYNWNKIEEKINSATSQDVENALSKNTQISLHDFAALLSPAAKCYIPSMAEKSHAATRKRFGKTIQLFAPCYLTNECSNVCTYCGFSYTNKIPRVVLKPESIEKEALALRNLGFEHVLLLTGESTRHAGVDYLEDALKIFGRYFSQVSLEVQPLETEDYKRLVDKNLYSVLVYQETYNTKNYSAYHPKGKKGNFNYRLETPDRLAQAEIQKIGLGALLGLSDWRVDSFFTALHLNYLRTKYWKTRYSVSFPRLRPAEGVPLTRGAGTTFTPIEDSDLVQLITAFRIFDENLELSLSTREPWAFRDKLIHLGITTMSAGSRTDPGGYASDIHALEQFDIDDERTPAEVSKMIRTSGLEPVWKDWGVFG